MDKFTRIAPIVVLSIALLLAVFAALQPAQASSLTVTTLTDSGPGSLRQAIDDAGQTLEADTITFDPSLAGQTITLTSGQLVITSELAIDGTALSNPVQISGGGNSRVFLVDYGGVVTLTHLIIADGATPTGSGSCYDLCGGGIYVNFDGQLTLQDSLVTKNYANGGGGVASHGILLIDHSQIINNTSLYEGGGMRPENQTLIRNSTIMSNTSGDIAGGAIFSQFGEYLHIENSTIAHNSTQGPGGGIYIDSTYGGVIGLRLSNSTLSNNTATGGGGALYAGANFTSTMDLTIINSTFSGNSSGVYANVDESSTLTQTIQNTIIANSVGDNCVGVSSDLSSLSDDASCQGFRVGNALLAPLADNGGSTLTHLPQPGSAAMGLGDPAVCQAAPVNGFDQRGVSRSPTKCDIGAVEVADVMISYYPFVLLEDEWAPYSVPGH